jgi:hypothetical protein
MLKAVGRTHPVDFKEPPVLPTWHSFTHGQYAIGGYSPPPPSYYYNNGGTSP